LTVPLASNRTYAFHAIALRYPSTMLFHRKSSPSLAYAKPAKTKSLLNQLNNYMEYKITITWNDDDVRHVASQMGVLLSNEQIINVLDYVEHNHDANYGINWDTIQWAIESELQHAE